MKTIENILIALTASVLVLGFVLFQNQNVEQKAGGISQNPAVTYWVSQTATSGLVALTTSEARILATGTDRLWYTITASPSCGQGFYLSMANDAPATANNSQFVTGSSSFEISPNIHSYTGAIHALSNGGTCNINVVGR